MKPIGQTFFVNEPISGAPGVFITKVDIYFKKVSQIAGIELQIRLTENGVPTPNILPFASKILFPTDVNPPVASDNASIATIFEFDTPVFVQSGVSYALVLVPLGGNPDYQIWTAEIGQNDVLTNSPIYTNNDTGDLFLSSNDKSWTPVITEDWKFKIYIANFTSTSGTAVFTTPNEEYIKINNILGYFRKGDIVFPSNGDFNIAVLNVSSNTGFIDGNFVFQSNGTSNVATGYVYGSNSTSIKLSNTTGLFSTSYEIKSNNTSTNATVISVSQNAFATILSNSFNVPDSSIFNINDIIYITSNSGVTSDIVKITGITNSTTVNFSNVYYNTSAYSTFTDLNCIYGKIKYNGTLYGRTSVVDYIASSVDDTNALLDSSTTTTTNNFVNAIGNKLIGIFGKGSAILTSVENFNYNQISPNIVSIAPANTNIKWYFDGIKNNNNYDRDNNPIVIIPGTSNEMNDFERVMMSRSNELKSTGMYPVGRIGERSLNVISDLTTNNNKISPSIDTMNKLVHLTSNLIVPENQLNGYNINLTDSNGVFEIGDTVSQGSAVAIVRYSNTSFIRVTDVGFGPMQANNTTIVKSNNNNVNAIISSINYFSDVYENNNPSAPRYISKDIYLATGQEAEDMLIMITAYMPLGSNIPLYCKFKNNEDNRNLKDIEWTRLAVVTNISSSKSNRDDLIEYKYYVPKSVNIISENVLCPPTSLTYSITANSSGFSNTNNVILLTSADTKLSLQDKIYYSVPSGNTAIEGLTGNTYYYVSFVNSTSFAVSETYNGSNVDITDLRTTNPGESHTITPISDVITLPAPYSTSELFVGRKLYFNDNLNNNFNTRSVKSIINATSFTVNKKLSFVSSNVSIGSLDYSQTLNSAFLYDGNDNIIRYTTDNDLYFDTYSQFTIKIVLVSNSSIYIPTVSDIRALAIQA